MADSTAYAASGGWSGGSALNAGGVLSNYYQKLKTVDPTSGSLTAAQPAQASTQPSSLARVATTTPATQATPTPQATTALPSIAATPLTMVQLPNMAGPMPAASTPAASTAAAGTGVSAASATPTAASTGVPQAAGVVPAAAAGLPVYKGPINLKQTLSNGAVINLIWDNIKQTYVIADGYKQAGGYLVPDKTSPTGYSDMSTMIATGRAPGEAAAVSQAISQANSTYGGQITQYQSDAVTYNAQQEKAKADAAQALADKASSFNLAGSLQAPKLTDVDQAAMNDMARVRSQYASGLGGVDAAAYNFAGQGAMGTQAAVSAANRQTAYADAFNKNYATFTNALTARQTADANASAQKLNYDVQGISQAVSILEQQAGQLTAGKQTAFNTALIPLKQQLKEYELAVKANDTSSPYFLKLIQGIISGGGQLAAMVPATA